MARVAGIQLEKNYKGEIQYVRVNYKKHLAEMKEFLEAKGVQEPTVNDELWANAITHSEFMNRIEKGCEERFAHKQKAHKADSK